ncbi:MAG: mechanosensitive ion channel [Candidatus Eremiobacteraeota bacterium]|nr:mechanosensitive ion channel [Candidatus Eremiobacteraeota bacterium]
MESTLIDLSSLLLLGILLGCHYLGFRRQARNSLGRTLQRAGKVRMLGVAVVAPISLFLALQGNYPLLTLVLNQVLLYWVGSTVIEVAWLLRRHASGQTSRWDWRKSLRLLWLTALIFHAGWEEPEYRDLAYALGATALVALALLFVHRWLFRPRSHGYRFLHRLQRRLKAHGYLMLLCLAGYYLLHAWTVVPITSRQLDWAEDGLLAVLGLAAIEACAATLEHVLRFRKRSEEVAQLAVDAFRAVVYIGVAMYLLAAVTHQDVSKLALSSAFFSVGLGFALKPTLGNMVAGLIMRVSQDFYIGDFVTIGELYGKVARIDWRSVSLSTLTNDLITLPHNKVAKSTLINHTRPSPKHAAYVQLDLSKAIAPGIVRAKLLEILATIPEVCPEPAPEVYLMDINGSSNTYRVRWWLAHINFLAREDSHVRRQLLYGLERQDLRHWYTTRLLEEQES